MDALCGEYVYLEVEDLTELVSKKELFVNKFYIDYQPLALDCLEEYIYNKSFSSVPFETFYYQIYLL